MEMFYLSEVEDLPRGELPLQASVLSTICLRKSDASAVNSRKNEFTPTGQHLMLYEQNMFLVTPLRCYANTPTSEYCAQLHILHWLVVFR